MPTLKKQIRAEENVNRNVLPGPDLEPVSGEGMAPISIKNDDFPVKPLWMDPDPFHDSYVLIPASRRLDRIARQMIRNGFKGD
jgi:hypothetical protein